MRKLVLLVLCMSLVAGMVFPAMAQDATPEALEPWTCPEGFEGQSLSVYNWSTYVAEDTISNFEALCGVTVTYDVFESGEALLARLRQGNPGYDIIVPPDYILATMISEEIVQPLDKENIPNFANITPELLDPVFDPGNMYSAPYQWGTIGLGYNIEAVGEITSWEDVWNYEGNVSWLEDPRTMLGVALLSLGYDPNSTDQAQIEEARDYLIENGSNVIAIAADDGQVLLQRGDVDIAVEYMGDIFQIIAEEGGEQFAYVIPEEGTTFWVDNMAIPTGAPNKALAEVFIDYILDPQVGADISNYTAFATPNQAAIDAGLIDEELLNNPGIYPSEETLSKLFLVQENPDAAQIYNDAWDEIKVLLGR